MDSIWKKNAPQVRFEALDGNKSTDVLIIGGGIAGILCAYKLKTAGVDCMLVEATELSGGITKNTTAKITLAHGFLYDKLIRRFGEEKARLYAEAQTQAGKEFFAGLMHRMMKDGHKHAGFELTPEMMQMLGGFTVLRLSSMMGMANISFTKEELLKMNKQLNRIRKPKN